MLLQKVCYIKSKSIQQVACSASSLVWFVMRAVLPLLMREGECGGGTVTACRSRTGANINILTKGFMCCTHTHTDVARFGATQLGDDFICSRLNAPHFSGAELVPHGPPPPFLLSFNLSVSSGNSRSLPRTSWHCSDVFKCLSDFLVRCHCQRTLLSLCSSFLSLSLSFSTFCCPALPVFLLYTAFQLRLQLHRISFHFFLF